MIKWSGDVVGEETKLYIIYSFYFEFRMEESEGVSHTYLEEAASSESAAHGYETQDVISSGTFDYSRLTSSELIQLYCVIWSHWGEKTALTLKSLSTHRKKCFSCS